MVWKNTYSGSVKCASIAKHREIAGILAVVMVIAVSACSNPMNAFNYKQTYGRDTFWTPEPAFLDGIPEGDDSYSQGFRDGCNTFTGFVASGFPRGHDFAYDAERGIKDRDYYVGYRIGSDYCTYYSDYDPL